MEQIPGIPTEIAVDGKVLKNLKPKGTKKPVYKNIYLLDSYDAEHLFLPKQPKQKKINVKFTKVSDAGLPRTISNGPAKVAEAPSNDDFNQAAIYEISIKKEWTRRKDDLSLNPAYFIQGNILHIEYRGDCARLYADGKLIADNFYYGRHFLMGLWRLPTDCTELELRILPRNSYMPVYTPLEASQETGEELISCFVM